MPGNQGHFAEAAERRTVTDSTGNLFARAARGDEVLSFGDTADWNVGNKSAVRIPAFRSGRVLRQFDNAMTDRLLCSARQRHPHEVFVDESFGNAIGFDNRLPQFWRQAREPLTGL